MGTYTTNYNLFMPSVGEQGWGDLVNGNFSTIDTTMGGLNTRLTAVENEVNGALSCTSVTTSGKVTANGGIGTTSLTTYGTITSTGKITANGGLAVTGGITSNLTGNVTGICYGKVYVTAKTTTSKKNGDIQYATTSQQTITIPKDAYGPSSKTYTSNTITVSGYSKISMSYPYQLYPGIYIPSSAYFTDSVPSSFNRTATLSVTKETSSSSYSGNMQLFVNGTSVLTVSVSTSDGSGTTKSGTYSVPKGASVYVLATINKVGSRVSGTLTIGNASTYYINVV